MWSKTRVAHVWVRKDELAERGVERVAVHAMSRGQNEVRGRSVPVWGIQLVSADHAHGRANAYIVYPAATISLPARSTSAIVPLDPGAFLTSVSERSVSERTQAIPVLIVPDQIGRAHV